MKKSKQLKIRKVWSIKPVTRIKKATKKDLLAKAARRELRRAKRREEEA